MTWGIGRGALHNFFGLADLVVAEQKADVPRIRTEQIARLTKQLPANIIANPLCVATLVAVFWGQTPLLVLLGWAAYSQIANGLMLAVAVARRRLAERVSTDAWAWIFAVAAAIDIVTWGAVPWLLFDPATPLLTLFFSGVILGVTATAALSYVSLTLAANVLPTVAALSLAARFATAGQFEYQLLALLVLVYLGMVLVIAGHLNTALLNSWRLRFSLERSERELIAAKDAAEAANRAKSEFLSRMSHELRTPLNAIFGFGQVLQADPGEPLSPNQSEAVNQILTSSDHLLELINEVLDLAGIESGKVALSVEAVDPGNIIESCLTIAEPMADERGIDLVNRTSGADLARVSADETRFRQALLNLVSNAVKYNRDGGTVTVDADETEDGMVRVSVADTGPGIAIEKQDQLFEPFNRLGAKDGTIEGTGIGLTITKQLVELMSGRIGFESSLGKGSVFWIELPLAVDEKSNRGDTELARISGTAKAPEGVLDEHVVLYVEDDPASLRLMETIIDRLTKLTLISADNAESALLLAEARQPDLILMDIDLPGMSGIDALEHLRGNTKTRDIPVIALSADAMSAQINKAMEAGFLRYLTKPIQIENLMSAIKEATGERSGARREN